MIRGVVEHYVVWADDNVIDHVSGLSDRFVKFLTDSLPDTIGNFALDEKMDGVLRIEVTIRAQRIA